MQIIYLHTCVFNTRTNVIHMSGVICLMTIMILIASEHDILVHVEYLSTSYHISKWLGVQHDIIHQTHHGCSVAETKYLISSFSIQLPCQVHIHCYAFGNLISISIIFNLFIKIYSLIFLYNLIISLEIHCLLIWLVHECID
jgi:hypothetical protein